MLPFKNVWIRLLFLLCLLRETTDFRSVSLGDETSKGVNPKALNRLRREAKIKTGGYFPCKRIYTPKNRLSLTRP